MFYIPIMSWYLSNAHWCCLYLSYSLTQLDASWQHVYKIRLDQMTKPKQSARIFQWRSLPCLAINLCLCVVIMVVLVVMLRGRPSFHSTCLYCYVPWTPRVAWGVPSSWSVLDESMSRSSRGHHGCHCITTMSDWIWKERCSQSFCLYIFVVLQLCQARYASVGVLMSKLCRQAHLDVFNMWELIRNHALTALFSVKLIWSALWDMNFEMSRSRFSLIIREICAIIYFDCLVQTTFFFFNSPLQFT
jgi:hypothetical protein